MSEQERKNADKHVDVSFTPQIRGYVPGEPFTMEVLAEVDGKILKVGETTIDPPSADNQ